MFPSRWGFHPCDYATFRKLKTLHQAYLKALRMARVWERWERKAPHNRVSRRRLRNAQGQTIAYDAPVPIPEPALCSVFTQKIQEQRFIDKNGNVAKDGFLMTKLVINDMRIIVDYHNARRPAASAAEVKPVTLSVVEIDALYEAVRKWVENQDVG
jgi:hypothetical protein